MRSAMGASGLTMDATDAGMSALMIAFLVSFLSQCAASQILASGPLRARTPSL